MPAAMKPYYPKLSTLITLDNIPTSLNFVKNLAQGIFSKLYYKNFQASVSPLGESAFYSLSIVPRDKISFDLVYGLKLVLNRDYEDALISSFPITVQYSWPVIAYFAQFNLNNFSFSAEEIFNIALVSLSIDEATVINEAINVFVNTTGDPINKFVDDLNSELGSNLTAPILYPTSANRIDELVNSINSAYGDGAAFAAFATYILDNTNVATTKNNLKLFFKVILPADLDQYIHDIITPQALVTLESRASIEFPRSILKPWILDGNGILIPDPDPDTLTYFDFAKAISYADTATGIGYNLDIASNLSPTYSEIGNTGLLVQIERLKLDLSTSTNIPEADAYCYSPDFMGVYARALSVTLPPKWFYDDSTPPGNTNHNTEIGGL